MFTGMSREFEFPPLSCNPLSPLPDFFFVVVLHARLPSVVLAPASVAVVVQLVCAIVLHVFDVVVLLLL